MIFIHETAVVYPNVHLEDDVYIGANCIIGAPAENKATWKEDGKGVLIKKGSIIHGLVTIDSGAERKTVIGESCFIMKGSYIAHDCVLENDVVMSAGSKLAGHCTIGQGTNIGMGVAVHQRTEVAPGCMIGMNSTITKTTKTKPNSIYIGSPARWTRTNQR